MQKVPVTWNCVLLSQFPDGVGQALICTVPIGGGEKLIPALLVALLSHPSFRK